MRLEVLAWNTISNGECITCPVGTYNDDFEALDCTKCPVGFYLDVVGADSSVNANSAFGTYAPQKGMSYCLECPIAFVCLIGS